MSRTPAYIKKFIFVIVLIVSGRATHAVAKDQIEEIDSNPNPVARYEVEQVPVTVENNEDFQAVKKLRDLQYFWEEDVTNKTTNVTIIKNKKAWIEYWEELGGSLSQTIYGWPGNGKMKTINQHENIPEAPTDFGEQMVLLDSPIKSYGKVVEVDYTKTEIKIFFSASRRGEKPNPPPAHPKKFVVGYFLKKSNLPIRIIARYSKLKYK